MMYKFSHSKNYSLFSYRYLFKNRNIFKLNVINQKIQDQLKIIQISEKQIHRYQRLLKNFNNDDFQYNNTWINLQYAKNDLSQDIEYLNQLQQYKKNIYKSK